MPSPRPLRRPLSGSRAPLAHAYRAAPTRPRAPPAPRSYRTTPRRRPKPAFPRHAAAAVDRPARRVGARLSCCRSARRSRSRECALAYEGPLAQWRDRSHSTCSGGSRTCRANGRSTVDGRATDPACLLVDHRASGIDWIRRRTKSARMKRLARVFSSRVRGEQDMPILCRATCRGREYAFFFA